mmetsp:Transcript_33722/g.53616  ORF Transcript_33722/g.53616 Transcript_33722/m.53616 type:complete len:444 (-) Transcript_33722:59-1390(-)
MRTFTFVFACWLSACLARRVQNKKLDNEDYFTLDQSHHSQSLVQLGQSAGSGKSAVDKLKKDFLAVLRKQPNWKNFYTYLQVEDDRGHHTLYGMEYNTWLSKLFRRIAATFDIKDFSMDFAEDHMIESDWKNGNLKREVHQGGQSLLAQWSMKLNTKKRSFFSPASDPLVIEGAVQFWVNSNGQVNFVQVKECFVNGLQVVVWPDMSPAQNFKTNMQKMREWIENLKVVVSKKMMLFKHDSSSTIYELGALPDTERVEHLMGSLKKSFANIFRKEPDWNIFAENFTAVDQGGKELKGLELSQNLTQLLRALPQEMSVRDFKVTFIEASEMYSAYKNGKLKGKSQRPINLSEDREGSVLLADWSFKLGGLLIEGQSLFQVNLIDDEIKTDRMEIQKILINGVALEGWPELGLTDDLTNSVTKIKEWAATMTPQNEDVDGAVALE